MAHDEENEDRAFLPIGSLATRILNLPPSTDSTTAKSPKPPQSSATTGQRLPVSTRSNLIGPQHGATVSAILASADKNRTGVEPYQIDRALDHSLPPCVLSCLETTSSYTADPVYGFTGTIETYMAVGSLKEEQRGELRNAIIMLEDASRPAPSDMIVYELGRMRVQTKAKAEDTDNMEFILRVYAEDMREYPADVIREACRKWSRTEKFFPAWSELKEILDRLAAKRRRLLFAVKQIGVI
jgi:hypothetical protein